MSITFYASNIFTIPMPVKYRNNIAPVNSNCVIGSVDGVKIALIIVATIVTYFQRLNIFVLEIIPKTPNIICTTGIWKAIPVV